LEECLAARRSVREYRSAGLSLAEVGQLLWAGQGITADGNLRTAPSAGALYPLEVYLAAGRVDGLDPGLYKYRPERHDLARVASGDQRKDLATAALDQDCVRLAPVTIAFAAVYRRITVKYGPRGVRYVHLEAGHATQSVLVQAVALGLGGVPVGAFDDTGVRRILRLATEEEPLYLLPIGRLR